MNDEELTASLSIDDSLSVSVSSFSQNLNANLNPDGSLVVEKFQIDPANFTLGNLSNVAITSPVDDAYLYYDLSTTSWKNSATSLDDKIDNQKAEVYSFQKRYGYAGQYRGIGLGKVLPVAQTIYSANINQVVLSIPAPKSGVAKRQRLKVRFEYSAVFSAIVDSGGDDYVGFTEQIRYEAKVTPVKTMTVETVSVDYDSSPQSVSRILVVDGNHTEEVLASGKMALSNTGSNIIPINSVYYIAGKTYISVIDSTGAVTHGSIIYYSNTFFVGSNSYQLVTPYEKEHRHNINTEIAAIAGLPVTTLNTTYRGYISRNVIKDVEIVLPPSATERDIFIKAFCSNDLRDTYGSGTMTIDSVSGTVENI